MSIQINQHIRLDVAGQNSLILYFSLGEQQESKIDPLVNNLVQQATQLIRDQLNDVVIDLIPSYDSILVMFNLLKVDHYRLRNQLKAVLKHCDITSGKVGQLVELPAYYCPEVGVDLSRIAKHANLTVEEVINLHQSKEYQVYAIGFAPGFAYLGKVDSRIAMARLATPRLNVPKGAIAIADSQTAIYPAQSPGGWNIIGLCPAAMFDVQKKPSMLVQVGDRVKFNAISKQEFLALGGQLPSLEVNSS